MSSENYVGIIMAENLRFLGEGSSAQGKPGAKARPQGVADAQPVNIPVPPRARPFQSQVAKGLLSASADCEPTHLEAESRRGTQEGR